MQLRKDNVTSLGLYAETRDVVYCSGACIDISRCKLPVNRIKKYIYHNFTSIHKWQYLMNTGFISLNIIHHSIDLVLTLDLPAIAALSPQLVHLLTT